LVAPDVVFERRDVKIADQDRAARRRLLMHSPIRHLVHEGELVGELDVDLGVRLVAARGDVEIVQFEPVRLSPEYDVQMTRVAFGAKVASGGGHEWDARNDGDPMIALLPADGDMRISGIAERFIRKICVRT